MMLKAGEYTVVLTHFENQQPGRFVAVVIDSTDTRDIGKGVLLVLYDPIDLEDKLK